MNALRDLPVIKDRTAFNLARWAELCADPLWVDIDGKIETDRYGQIIMNPPAEPSHGGRQADLTLLLSKFAPTGKIIVECPVSTSEGVKVPDVVWASKKRLASIGGKLAFTAAPEICIEVLSASNTRNEIEEKRRLYFEAGAGEVWLCERDGRLRFFLKTAPARLARQSALCPKMPARIAEQAGACFKGEISAGEFKDFIGENIRLAPINLHRLYRSDELLSFFMGKNMPERQDFIIENVRVEKDLVEA